MMFGARVFFSMVHERTTYTAPIFLR
jgi:hypothetical protein